MIYKCDKVNDKNERWFHYLIPKGEKKMSRLIIIGNGFDRAHKLPTSYENFKKFVKIRDSHFYQAISRYIPKEVLWSDFERALGKLDDYKIQQDNSSFYLDYGDDNWRDSANHDFQYMIQQDLEFTSKIPYYFEEWILSIDIDVPSVVSCNTINRRGIFLNFNYTDTLECIYGIPAENILYIHGKALRNDNLIVGHHDSTNFQVGAVTAFNAAEEHGRYFRDEEEDFRITEAREIIQNYYRGTYKDTESIIRKNHYFFESLTNITEVYILGHSLSDIDMAYFIKIRESVSPWCRWYISYHSEKDIYHIEWFARKLNIEVLLVEIPKL